MEQVVKCWNIELFKAQAGDNILAYEISGNANGDDWEKILVIFNGNREEVQTDIPKGNWTIVLQEDQINEKGLGKHPGGKISVKASSAMILVI